MKRFFASSYITLVFLFLYLPIVVLVIFSFNNTTFSGLWHGFTWQWYQTLFQDTDLQIIAVHSLLVAFLASSFASLIGTLGAIAFYKYRFYGRKLIYGTIFTLIILPDLILGITLLLWFHTLHLALGFWSLLLAHVTFCIPFVFVIIYGRLVTFDKNLFEAAKDLGARDSTVIRKVILPLLKPALIAAWMLSFTLSLDDVVVSFFVSGPNFQILPLYIYSAVRLGVTPELNALCSLILLFTLVMAIVGQLLLRRKK